MSHEQVPPSEPTRRGFLGTFSNVGAAAGVAAAYGTLGAMAARYLYPASKRALGWMYLAREVDFAHGSSLSYRTPAGERVTVARQGSTKQVEDFVALSSTCPHLGCQVHWEVASKRFFCPCHNGVFDASGKATNGPPADAGQSLGRYALKLEAGLLYIEVPLEGLSS